MAVLHTTNKRRNPVISTTGGPGHENCRGARAGGKAREPDREMREDPEGRQRLFVGIGVPEAVHPALEEYLRATFGERLPGRAVPPRNWHLTLRFLGATTAAAREHFVHELGGLAAPPRFRVSLATPGAFPSARRARVLWVGVGDGAEALRRLAGEIEGAARRAGFPPETQAYTPHLTLSRIQPPADLRPSLSAAALAGIDFPATAFALYRSVPGAGPPRYDELQVFALP
jgi:2'-5' RNA ligase